MNKHISSPSIKTYINTVPVLAYFDSDHLPLNPNQPGATKTRVHKGAEITATVETRNKDDHKGDATLLM